MKRVLVIEDNQDFRDLIAHWLREAGYAVDVAADGQRGLELQRKAPADLVVTDIFMPDKDGIETIFELRKEYPAAKIIAMTGRESVTSFDALPVASELGAARSFKKPFDLDDLVKAVRELIGGP